VVVKRRSAVRRTAPSERSARAARAVRFTRGGESPDQERPADSGDLMMFGRPEGGPGQPSDEGGPARIGRSDRERCSPESDRIEGRAPPLQQHQDAPCRSRSKPDGPRSPRDRAELGIVANECARTHIDMGGRRRRAAERRRGHAVSVEKVAAVSARRRVTVSTSSSEWS